MGKNILILDDQESCRHSIALGLEDVFPDINIIKQDIVHDVGGSMFAIEINVCCDTILLDHSLTNDGEAGLKIARKVKKTGSDKIIISTSNFVATSNDLVSEYRSIGVNHFPGKNFMDIKKCLDGECKCHLL